MKRKEETNEKEDTEDLGSTGDESEDGHSSNTHNDQDSDVSFDDEIDTTVHAEEEWIDYMQRSTDEAMEKIEDSMLEQDSKSMRWRLALRIATSLNERWLMKAAECNLETQLKIQDQQSNWETKKKMEKTTSTSSSSNSLFLTHSFVFCSM